MTMRIMESDGDVKLGTCRGPNSEEALSIPMMLLRGMTNCYTSVKLGGQTDVLLSVRPQRGGRRHESEARWLPMRTLFATLPRAKVANATCLSGLTPGGSYFARE